MSALLLYCCFQNHCGFATIGCLGFQSAGTVGSSHEDSRGQDVGLLILWKEVHHKIFLEKAQKTPHRQYLDKKYLIRILFDGSYLKGETPYSCNLCGKTFAFQQSFHKHMLYHTDEKPYTCTWKDCGKAFKELSTLQNHERIHSGERPFVCETCNKSFRQRVSYLVHRRWVLYNNFEVKDNRYLDEFSWNGLTGFTLGCCHTLVLPVARNSDTRSEKLFDWSIVIRFMWAGDPEDPPV